MRPFYQLGLQIARFFMGSKGERRLRMRIRENLCSLAPMERAETLLLDYYADRIGLLIFEIVLVLGIALCFLVFGGKEGQLTLGKDKGAVLKMGEVYFFLGATGALLFVNKKSAMDKAMKLREKQMRMDYPKIVNKLTMLFSAGLTIREAWGKVVTSYIRQREEGKPMRYAYEEMLMTYRELQGGMSEGEAYNRFGRRCKLAGYMKLSALLVQNLKKGNDGLLQLLAYEAVQAMEERKSLAKKWGEEAATKLLLPMLLLLSIVIVILIVPAFMTLQF